MTIENDINLEDLDGNEILQAIYGKELNCKKNILEYISLIKDLKKYNLTGEQMQETYTLIYKGIDNMATIVKPNTIMFLKNDLKSNLAKYVKDRDPKELNYFFEFFKSAYPPKMRKKDYTWTLMDINRITNEQIWHTLTYINAWCLDGNRLSVDEKEDIIKMVDILVKSNKVKYINQIKSLEKLNKVLKLKIISKNNKFELKIIL